MKGIRWGKIEASGCGNLLLLEWGFVKLAKQYCINRTGHCLPNTTIHKLRKMLSFAM